MKTEKWNSFNNKLLFYYIVIPSQRLLNVNYDYEMVTPYIIIVDCAVGWSDDAKVNGALKLQSQTKVKIEIFLLIKIGWANATLENWENVQSLVSTKKITNISNSQNRNRTKRKKKKLKQLASEFSSASSENIQVCSSNNTDCNRQLLQNNRNNFSWMNE